MSKYRIALATAGLSLIMAGQASAATTTFSFDGVVNNLNNKGGFDYSGEGTKVSGVINFDSADFTMDPPFPGSASGSASNASYSFTSDYYGSTSGTSSFYFGLTNSKVSTQSFDDYVVEDKSRSFRIGLTGSLFAGNSLSLTQPILLQPTPESGFIFFNGRTLNFQVDHASMSVAAVPEPETYAMLLAGLGLIGAVAKRRKAKAV